MMPRWRLILIAVLMLLPVLSLVGIGLWMALQSGHWLWLAWLIPCCWGGAWLLLRRTKRTSVPLPEIGSRIHWTPHDQAAAEIITIEQRRVDQATSAQLIDPEFYQQVTIDLATKLARHYYPKSDDPLGSLSIVELATVSHLVCEDLEGWFQKYVPGSHLVTVSQWRMLGNLPPWLNVLSNVGSLASVVWDPTKIPRYLAMRGAGDPLISLVKSNLLGAFFRFYTQRIGYYLIELNSGRLRGGSSRYRRTMELINPSESPSSKGDTTGSTEEKTVTVTIAIVGQVKAGKSSLVNCLLGDQQAAVDVLPLTRDVKRYELTGSSVTDRESDRLILLDTPGYSDAGTTAAQIDATREAVRHADLVLLVMAATSPAKQSDAEMLAEMNRWFQDRHQLKPPPVIGVVSKVDALSPIMEWATRGRRLRFGNAGSKSLSCGARGHRSGARTSLRAGRMAAPHDRTPLGGRPRGLSSSHSTSRVRPAAHVAGCLTTDSSRPPDPRCSHAPAPTPTAVMIVRIWDTITS
jgi:uncharacterized protein